MIKKMGGNRREWSYLVLTDGDEIAVTNKEKAELMANTFIKVHSSNNLSEEGRSGRAKTKSGNMEALRKKENTEADCSIYFGRVKKGSGMTAPGKDEICYVMIKHLVQKV